MPSEYIIRRLPETVGSMPLSGPFDPTTFPAPYGQLDEAAIDCFPWATFPYQPRTAARVGYNQQGLHVLLYSDEAPQRAEVLEQGGHVCADSCLEFFFNPFPASDRRYLNIEMNPRGIMLLGIGDGRHDRLCLKRPPLPGMNIRVSAPNSTWWAISYTVPMDFIALHYGEKPLHSGCVMAGNFYKCGDNTIHPHYGCWQHVDTAQPDYHQPRFFGRLILA